jgi:arsenate reductase
MMEDTIRVLFVCIHNSARSQMAEAFLKELGGDRFQVESAGIEPGTLNPAVVAAMKEIGIDISGNPTKTIDGFIEKGVSFDFVITVCDEASAERCPVFPGKTQRLHWGFPDPSALQGSDAEKMPTIRKIRDDIKEKVAEWLKQEAR